MVELHRSTLIIVGLLLFSVLGTLSALSPDDELWESFLGRPVQVPRVPEDEELGLLADLNNPEPEWIGGIGTCEAAFNALSEGFVPEELLAPELSVPLMMDLNAVLSMGIPTAGRRYGMPRRSGSKLEVPLRLSSGENIGYGHIYLRLTEGEWLIEQWVLNLTPFISESEE